MPYTAEQRRAYDKLRPNRRSKRGTKIHLPGANMTQQFIGCDGEGAGGKWIEVDTLNLFDLMHERNPRDKWQQHYKLFRMGSRYIQAKGGPLRTIELLEFILASSEGLYVGYYFNYDVTMILRDIDTNTCAQLFSGGFRHIVEWKGYALQYIPKRMFSIGRAYIDENKIVHFKRGTLRTIYDVGQFFQCSFVKALQQWKITTDEELERIKIGKDKRGSDVGVPDAEISDEDIEYNRLECEHLAALMERFRDACTAGNCVPRQWAGPGQIAVKLLQTHHVKQRKELHLTHLDRWEAAFYGGRFEASHIGRIDEAQTVHEYDIRSAYPAAMLKLPCLDHGVQYEQQENCTLDDITEHCVAEITYSQKTGGFGSFPVRRKDGSIYFPRAGIGIYGGPEILAAVRAGCDVTIRAIYGIDKRCACIPFDWLPEMFAFRRSLGPTKGIALKLGLNSLYGKLLQRIGSRPYYNPIYATLITSYVRAQLIDAYAHNPSAVIMLATDALYSLEQLPTCQIGDGLGQWEHKTSKGIFICKPGIYVAGDSKTKTRGIHISLFHDHFPHIEKRWLQACERSVLKPPQYAFDFKLFCGMRLALMRDYDIRGSWATQEYTLDFDWTNKRKARPIRRGTYVVTQPHDGGSLTRSVVYGEPNTSTHAVKKLMAEAMPDYFAFEPEGFDHE